MKRGRPRNGEGVKAAILANLRAQGYPEYRLEDIYHSIRCARYQRERYANDAEYRDRNKAAALRRMRKGKS